MITPRSFPFLLVSVAGILSLSCAHASTLVIPAYTAYAVPDANGARFSERQGVTRWNDPDVKIVWYGHFPAPGVISSTLALRLPEGQASTLRLTVAGQAREATAIGAADGKSVSVDFGEFKLKRTGYHSFTLESLNEPGRPFGNLETLTLAGPPMEKAQFNLKPRRNAASVHLFYPVPKETDVAAFYCEVTAVEDPVTTFYMACGWHRGYFGMQVNSETERRIIFSVWDSGGEAVDRDKVQAEDRVRLMGKGEGVYTGDFGHEGTGGHSHLKFMWKTGETQRFLVTAQPTNETFTVYSGYYFRPDKKEWMLISSWNAPGEGGWLRRLHSFSENFWGSTGNLRRKARYGNQWIRTPDGEWMELTTAGFSHDATGREDRRDRFMGVENGQFFLSHGGFVDGYTEYGTKFQRPPVGVPPKIELPSP